MYQYTYTINKNNDFITIYDKQRTYYVNKSNEELYIKDLGNLHDNRVNYLFPLLTVSIDDNVYALNIQKSGKYFDLVGNYINKNMIETILDIEIYEDYTINIIDKDMNHITVINQSILLEKDKYKIV
tara:strand:- start:1 stop:381 length:381 start_codon:yes stop_codon:yes gene_type:complete